MLTINQPAEGQRCVKCGAFHGAAEVPQAFYRDHYRERKEANGVVRFRAKCRACFAKDNAAHYAADPARHNALTNRRRRLLATSKSNKRPTR
ncbi:hypothetical protein WKW80_09280 [Variovorax humicola]|uniref:Uncharacterized protein n=1 Tax=Variovorax humicola TaxID=1769758 RepID=A0ABU8VWN7_9BURK